MTKQSRSFLLLLAAGVTLATVACGGSSSATGPEVPASATPPRGGATIAGTVQSGNAAAGPVGASAASGLRVSVTGTALQTVTDAAGRFALQGVPPGRVELRFQGGGIDARLGLEGVENGKTLTLTVRVSGSSATLVDDDDEGEVEFEGKVDSVGAASLVVDGRMVHVNDLTRLLDEKGMPIPLSAFQPGDFVEVEGTAQSDGSVLAKKIKLEDYDDDEGEVEFEGKVDSVGASSLVVDGRMVHVNDLTRLLDEKGMPIPLSAFQPGDLVEVEGTAQSDGSVLARKIKLEDDDDHDGDDDGDDDHEMEFKGTISSLNPLVIAGRAVTTDGSTKYFGHRHEVLPSSEVLKLGNRVEVEGIKQPDNSVLARKIQLEDED